MQNNKNLSGSSFKKAKSEDSRGGGSGRKPQHCENELKGEICRCSWKAGTAAVGSLTLGEGTLPDEFRQGSPSSSSGQGKQHRGPVYGKVMSPAALGTARQSPEVCCSPCSPLKGNLSQELPQRGRHPQGTHQSLPQTPRCVPQPLWAPARPGHHCTLARAAAAVPVPAPASVPCGSSPCLRPLSSAQKAGGLTRACLAALEEKNSCGATCPAHSGLLPGAAVGSTCLVPFLRLFLSANSQ